MRKLKVSGTKSRAKIAHPRASTDLLSPPPPPNIKIMENLFDFFVICVVLKKTVMDLKIVAESYHWLF